MSEYRYHTLGDNVIPENYRISFKTNMKTFRFSGTETISVNVGKACNSIKLNARELDILDAEVKQKAKAQKARVSYYKKNEEVVLHFKDKIRGKAELHIEFRGENNDKMYGFYRSKYSEKGKDRYILTSQFEAADARAAFPCFDEPSFKATFDIAMEIDNGLDAISNMPVKSTVKMGENRKLVAFKTTPRMSSYLVYLGVGNFDYVQGSLGKLKIRAVTVPGKGRLGKMSIVYAKKFVSFFEKYFGIKYPLPKLDLIAIPDFSAGAMENWGAVTFREIAILGDEKNTPIAVKQSIAETIAHELAHQWFGDLVTMNWWDDLWLNESFATFMSYKAMDDAFPEWNVEKQYFDEVIATAFAADSLKTTHPISVKVNTPKEIDQIFDSISYEKGGTVLHMLENFAGKEAFRKGLHDYLKSHAYGNGTKYALWNSIGHAAGGRKSAEIAKFASSWINNPGYPIVEIENENGKIYAKQRRFLIVESNTGKEENWPVPLNYLTSNGDMVNEVLGKTRMLLKARNSEWVKLNHGQHYLYRTDYPDEMLDRLGRQIKSGRLKGTDSWGIENDVFVLARCGRMPVSEYLEFVENHCMNADYPLSFNLASHLGWTRDMLYEKDGVERVREVSRKYYRKILSELGWQKRKGESTTDTMLRSIAISGLGHIGERDVIRKADSLFNRYMSGKAIDPDLKSAVYGIAAWNGDDSTYRKVVERYKTEQTPDDKRRLLQTLALFGRKDLLTKTLDYAFSKDVRLQDSYVLPAIISSNPVGRDLIWKWTKNNWQSIRGKYKSGTHMLERFVTNMSALYEDKDFEEIESFFSKKENTRDDIKLRVKQTLERIRANKNFMKTNGLL